MFMATGIEIFLLFTYSSDKQQPKAIESHISGEIFSAKSIKKLMISLINNICVIYIIQRGLQ